jgi:hypothetical protein
MSAIILTIAIVTYYHSKEGAFELLARWVLLIYSISLVCVLLAYLTVGTKYWYLKYSLGIMIGGLAYFLKLKKYDKYSAFLVSLMAFFEIILLESMEYLFLMDPSPTPSLFAITSFSHPTIWGLVVFIIIAPAWFFTSKYKSTNVAYRWGKGEKNYQKK